MGSTKISVPGDASVELHVKKITKQNDVFSKVRCEVEQDDKEESIEEFSNKCLEVMTDSLEESLYNCLKYAFLKEIPKEYVEEF